MLSMQKLKDMTDAELIRHLKESGIAHGPIVESTRTLYEKKLFEYERKKKSFPNAAESSYESKQEYSSREYDANQGSLINVGGMAFGTHHSQQEHLNYLQEELPGTSYSNMRGARGARQKVGAGGARRKKDIIETKEKIAAGVTRQKKTIVETKQKLGAKMTRQKMTVVETVQKGVRGKRQMKDVGETTQLVYTSSPASDLSATGSIVEATLDPEIKAASISTCRRGRAKYQRPPTPRRIQPELMGALEIEKQPEENSNHFLAMSLVPLLDKVPEEKMVALRHDLLNLITSYSMDTPPKLPRFSGIAFPPSDKHY